MPPLNRTGRAVRTRAARRTWGVRGRRSARAELSASVGDVREGGQSPPFLLFLHAGCGAVQKHGRPRNLGGAGELGAPAEDSVSVGDVQEGGVSPLATDFGLFKGRFSGPAAPLGAGRGPRVACGGCFLWRTIGGTAAAPRRGAGRSPRAAPVRPGVGREAAPQRTLRSGGVGTERPRAEWAPEAGRAGPRGGPLWGAGLAYLPWRTGVPRSEWGKAAPAAACR
jgi:hypothetical protein